MKKLFVAALFAWGVMGCGAGTLEEEEAPLESTEQELCPATCPSGTQFSQYTWVCVGGATTACRSGYEQEYALCYDPANGGYVMGTTTCRRRCGCLIEA
ncbi:hypothetical protein LY474_32450 [Myxococcus stipitatus]|uniref:hypothetical protein n=1 Tax=Myxococcus stipitatus TaxID=83455 RepID=UPI001F432540|nr:hypothetical protein [Myxococcus stipitatus]MCE9672529.1 hypothetical protein [Myxococcus stipitatus]